MQSQNNNSPDKDKPSIIAFIRWIIRALRKYRVRLLNRGKIKFGNNSYIGSGADFYIPNTLIIESNVSIGGNCIIQTNLKIGSNSLISSNVSFIGNDHDLSLDTESAYHSGRNKPSTITLEGNNFIGFGVTILGNINIGKGAIVGAGSFVNKDVPENAVVVGVPATFLKNRNEL